MNIEQADIREKWDWVRPALEEMCEKMELDWRPEDIYADCRHGAAFLYVGVEEEGFMVVKELRNQYTAERMLHVWVLYGFLGQYERGAVERYMPHLDDLARQCGYKRVTIDSPRKAWQRIPGWRELTTTYVHEVA